MSLDGHEGWRKRRLRRAALLIPPGNAVLAALGSGCHMVGPGWAAHEKNLFRIAHPEQPPPVLTDGRTLWLPHLPGESLRVVASFSATDSAFSELAHFHRLGDHAIHGDPHAGNFLYDAADGLSRIIDFETTATPGLTPAQGRARDFAILALDLWKTFGSSRSSFLPDSWLAAYGMDENFCPVEELLRAPGPGLAAYWTLLGYQWRFL
jgi:hypothetical protein